MTEHTSPPSSPGPAADAPTRMQRRIGTVLTVFVALFLGFDVVIHVLDLEVAHEAMIELGWPGHLTPVIGVIESVALVLYLVRRTALPGAVLLTGYLGGAVATHLRAESPLLGNTLFPIYTGIVLWTGLLLLDPAARTLLTGRLLPGRSPVAPTTGR